MQTPKISVVIPLYNKATHILDSLKSISEQSYAPDEIIIIDDGSTDGGDEIVKRFNFPNVRLIKQSNQGVSAARNHGIEVSRNDYIAFLDADDQWLPFFLEEMVALINKFPTTGIYTSRYQCIEGGNEFVDAKIHLENADPKGILLNNYFEIASKGDLPFMISSTLIHKSLLEKIGYFPVGEKMGEDQDFFIRIALQGAIAYSPNINLFYHRDSENKVTNSNIPSQECPFSERLHNKIKTQSVSFNGANAAAKAQNIKHMLRYSAAHLCHLAKLNINAGKFKTARALLADPRCALKPKHRIGLYCIAWVKQGLSGIKSVLNN